jgi:N-acetylglucosaminyldiphosphoundecaprenol N-acetyl-beta-D-mannosaminyltransferase
VPRAVRILDIEIDVVTLPEAVAMIAAAIDARRGHGGPVFQVATVNPEFVMLARSDQDFRRILQSVSLRVPDGVGLNIAARILGLERPGRVPGVELVDALSVSAARRGDSIFLLGGAPGVAEAAGARLVRDHPGLKIAGTHTGPPDESGDADSLAAVRESGAGILLVAYGAPQQERWLARNLEPSGATAGIGVGGTFDYLGGRVRRAPAWMRRAGLEWLFRLLRQPWRARRQLALPRFILAVLRQRLVSS